MIHLSQLDCKHNQVMPIFDEDLAKDMSSEEIRRVYPRFSGICPCCRSRVTVYASFKHYLAGDW